MLQGRSTTARPKLRATAQALHPETVDGMLRTHLDEFFAATLRDCYQVVKVLPPPDEVVIEPDKTTLVIVRPGGQAEGLPISPDWQAWWGQQAYKNRVLFLSGSKDTFQKVLDSARQMRALESIADELRAENTPAEDPQWRSLDGLTGRVGLQFRAGLKEAFDQIVYPSIQSQLRAAGIELAFAENNNGEATVRKTLEAVQKFTAQAADDSFRTRAEARLFGGAESKVVLWSDFKRAAAVNTNWPLHKVSALEDLKTDCLRRGLWREEGNYVRRGPFPPPVPEVAVKLLSVEDSGDGVTYLKIEPLHAAAVVYETGDSAPTTASSPVPTPTRFEARGLRYRFLAFDPNDLARVSAVKDWTATLRLKHQLRHRGDHYELELQALPKVNTVGIRYTTDGSSPTGTGAATYDGPIRVPAECRIICVQAVVPALGLGSDMLKVPIPRGEDKPGLDPARPARWNLTGRLDDTTAVWDFLARLEKAPGMLAHSVLVTAKSTDGQQELEYTGAMAAGYDGAALRSVIEKLQAIVAGGGLRMTVGSLDFPTGQALLDWLKATQQTFQPDRVSQ